MKNSDDILSSLVTLSNPFLGDAGIIEASPALPYRATPRHTGPSPTQPVHACQTSPSSPRLAVRCLAVPAPPCRACDARPGLDTPYRATPCPAVPAMPFLALPRPGSPCHALDLRELAQHQQQIVTDWQMRFPRQPCIRLLFRFEHPDANDRCRSLVDAFEFPPFGFVYTHAGKPTPFCKQLQHPCRRNSANPCLVNKNSPRARRNPGAKRTNLTGLFTLR